MPLILKLLATQCVMRTLSDRGCLPSLSLPGHVLHALTNTRHLSLPVKLANTNTCLFNFCLKYEASICTREPSSPRKDGATPAGRA